MAVNGRFAGSDGLGGVLAAGGLHRRQVRRRSARLGNGFDTTDAVRQKTEDRPAADARGIISYPGYQVAVARRGDTVASVATRVGLAPTNWRDTTA